MANNRLHQVQQHLSPGVHICLGPQGSAVLLISKIRPSGLHPAPCTQRRVSNAVRDAPGRVAGHLERRPTRHAGLVK